MNFGVFRFSSFIGSCLVLACSLSSTVADISPSLTLIYSGEEQGQLGLHGCGAEQVGGLSRRQTVFQSLREKPPIRCLPAPVTLLISPTLITNLSTKLPFAIGRHELRRSLSQTATSVFSYVTLSSNCQLSRTVHSLCQPPLCLSDETFSSTLRHSKSSNAN